VQFRELQFTQFRDQTPLRAVPIAR